METSVMSGMVHLGHHFAKRGDYLLAACQPKPRTFWVYGNPAEIFLSAEKRCKKCEVILAKRVK